jgi:hypothetical protein
MLGKLCGLSLLFTLQTLLFLGKTGLLTLQKNPALNLYSLLFLCAFELLAQLCRSDRGLSVLLVDALNLSIRSRLSSGPNQSRSAPDAEDD